jgi:hypothetical protein
MEAKTTAVTSGARGFPDARSMRKASSPRIRRTAGEIGRKAARQNRNASGECERGVWRD